MKKLRTFLSIICLSISSSIFAKSTANLASVGLPGEYELQYHPFNVQNSAQEYLRGFLSEPIIYLDNQWKWQCLHCTNLPELSNNGIELTGHEGEQKGRYPLSISIEIEPNWHWGDGKPITPQDVIFSWKVARHAPFTSKGVLFFQTVTSISVDKKNKQRLSFHFKKKAYPYEELGQIYLIPKHLEEEAWDNAKNDFAVYLEESLYNKNPKNPGLYNGGFTFGSKQADSLHLQRNTYSRGSHGNLDGVEVKKIATNKSYSNLDFIPEEIFINLGQDLRAQLQSDKKFRTILADSLGLEVLAFNLRNPLFVDHRLRKALRSSLEKEELFNKAYSGGMIPANSILHPRDFYLTVPKYFVEFDLTESQSLLSQGRWETNDGSCRSKNSKPLQFDIVTNQNPHRQLAAQIISAQWKKIGVCTQVEIIPDNSFISRTIQRMDYSGVALLGITIPVEGRYSSLFSKDHIPTMRNDYTGKNIFAWNSEKVQNILNALELDFDRDNRKNFLAQLDEHILNYAPFIPIGFHLKIAFASLELSNIEIAGHQYPSSIGAKNWLKSVAAF